MIFIDSSIPMYLIGGPHPNKAVSRGLLERSIQEGVRLVTDAEVFQEVLHRYVAIARRDAIQPAFDALRGVVDEVLPVELADVERAKTLVHGGRLSARDSIHVAIMQRHGIVRILSFDTGFDGVPGVERISV